MSEEFNLAHHTMALEVVTLHYVTAGSGDPLVLLHGWPQTWYEWRRVMPALAQHYTVIAPDMRFSFGTAEVHAGIGRGCTRWRRRTLSSLDSRRASGLLNRAAA